MSDLAEMTIHQVASLIQRRAVSPVDVTSEALKRIARLDSQLHAFITVRADEALAEARVAEAEIARGEYRGPLHGVPVGIKDNIAVAGSPTTCGSRLMCDQVTDYDATVVERLRQAGAVIVGKTNMHEWAGGGTSANGPFGSVSNPWDTTCVAGGSSGGSAAAVSASLVHGAVGTDGMGSIRIPASYCGVVGYKPTYGLVSRFGELPPTSSTVDHLGPLAKDVTDAATLLTVLAGPDPKDPTSIPSTLRDYAADLDRTIEGLRVGVPRNFFPDHTTPEVQDAVTRAVDALVSLGAEVHEIRIPSLQHMPLMSGANWNESRSYLLQFARLGPSAFADQTIWERQIVGQLLRAADLAKLTQLRNLIRQEFLAVMETVDVIATATTLSAAFPIDPRGLLAGAKPMENHVDITNVLTYPYNLVGMPAISLPCGFTLEGLPVGLMLAGRHWEDDVVLRTAYAYERVAAWAYAIPPFCSVETV